MSNLTFALPKGRLEEQTREYFTQRGLGFAFENRKLVTTDASGLMDLFLVKNADLPTYVHHGIAGLGVCGEDVLYESGHEFVRLLQLPFGSTRMCLAARADMAGQIRANADWTLAIKDRQIRIATKFTRFSMDYFHNLGIPVDLIKLNGSVELAPVLGLAPFIVDLVETGSTLKANNLEVVSTLAEIKVWLVANPACYKLNYQKIDRLVKTLAT